MLYVLLAQILDPLRIVLVIVALFIIAKLFHETERFWPTVATMVLVAIISSSVLAATQTVSRPGQEWAIVTGIGFVSNCILWAIFSLAPRIYRLVR